MNTENPQSPPASHSGVAVPGAMSSVCLSFLTNGFAWIISIARRKTSSFFGPVLLASTLVSPASGEVVLSEAFVSGERLTQSPPATSAWYGSASTNLTQPSAGMLTLDTSAAGHLIAHFTDSGPVALGVGEGLKLTFGFRMTGALNFNTGVRIGLFDSRGSANRVTADNQGVGHARFQPYAGYGAWFNPGGGGSAPMSIRKRSGTDSVNGLLNTATAWTTQASGGATTVISDDTAYTGELHVFRALDRVAVTFTLFGPGISSGATVSCEDIGSTFAAFDTFAIWVSGSAGDSFSLTSVEIEDSVWESARVQYNADGRLIYLADSEGNRIPDFSHAGYEGGGVPLPDVPVRVTISPIAGDNTAHIQAAIDQVGNMTIQSDGYRGAVRLSAGSYEVVGTLILNKNGVVLSGVGDGDNPASNTILRRTGTSTASVIRAGGTAGHYFEGEIAGTRRDIISGIVYAGSRTFRVDDASPFSVGDDVVILHPSTQAWIDAVDGGGVVNNDPWQEGDLDIRYHRYITAITPNNTITVDAPVFNHLERSLSQSYLFRVNRSNVRKKIGIEDLLIHIETAGPTSETHSNTAVTFRAAENSWIRDCTIRHFVYAAVNFTNSSTRCTVERVRGLEPHSLLEGSRRYNFATFSSQLILFRDCVASYARHAFVANGRTFCSGNVVLNSTSDHGFLRSEGHRRWSTGLLFDGLVATNNEGDGVAGFHNRGDYGGSHGWAAAHSVMWRCDADGGNLNVQKPPTAQNYAIGCFGDVTGGGGAWPWPGASGHIEGTGAVALAPFSLYLAQLDQRLGDTGFRHFETEELQRATSGPNHSINPEKDASAGFIVYLSSAGAGNFIDFTLPGVPAGTYAIKLHYKRHSNRGMHTLEVNGTQVGGVLDQYGPGTAYLEHTFGTYTVASGGSQTIRLVNQGKNPSAGNAMISADAFTLVDLARPIKVAIPPAAVTASSSEGADYLPANTVDGNLATRWSALGLGEWVRYDLGESRALSFVKTAFFRGDERIALFDARVSDNGSNWTTVGSYLSSGATAGFEKFDFPETSGRYLRIDGYGNSNNLWNSITGVEVWGRPASIDIPGSSVTASADNGNVPENTVDGDFGTRWSASGLPQWIRYDLGAIRTVAFVKVAFFLGDERVYAIDIEVSNDGNSWTTVGSYLSSGATGDFEAFDFSNTNARYVRITGYGNSENLWNSFKEVEVWGL